MFLLLFLVVVTAGAPLLAPYDPARQFRDFADAGPSSQFWLGNDEYGRDIFSRLLYAGRWSLLAGSLATTLALALGSLLGLLAAALPGVPDRAVRWLAGLTLTFPWLYLLFALRGAMPIAMGPEVRLVGVIALVGCAGWATPALLVRGVAATIAAADYVSASRAFGATAWQRIRWHLLPALGPVLRAQFFVLLPQFVMAESALSFFGLGLAEPTPTWGNMLAVLRQNFSLQQPWMHAVPLLPLLLVNWASNQIVEKGNQTP